MFIEMKHISKTFPGVKALSDVSFGIEKGSVHGLVGENGAGKSTLIKILTGVYTPDEGSEITIEGKKIEQLSPIVAMKEGISVTYQDFALFPNLTVAENINISKYAEMKSGVIDWKKMRATAKEILDNLGIEIDLNVTLGSLSAAKQQMVAIARALANQTKLMILDEPTSSLSNNETEQLFNIVRNLRDNGISVLFISHKLDEIYAICDTITIFRDGQCLGTYDIHEIDENMLISKMVGRNVEYIRKENPARTTEKLLEVKDLCKSGNYVDINFHLNKGEILGFTGLVGAGRSELFQSIFGVTRPDSGKIFIEGNEVKIENTQRAKELGIGYIPENRLTQGLILSQSVENNIASTVYKKMTNKLRLVSSKKVRESAVSMIDKLRIKPEYPYIQSAKLSGGNQQRIVIAKWILSNPKILIVDEPTQGVDIGAKSEIHDLLRMLVKQGIGVIMVSSELPEVMALSDRILVMRKGRILAEYEGGQVENDEIMRKSLLGD